MPNYTVVKVDYWFLSSKKGKSRPLARFQVFFSDKKAKKITGKLLQNFVTELVSKTHFACYATSVLLDVFDD